MKGRSRRYERPAPAPAALIHGRNAVLEAARAGKVVKVFQASGLGHDPRLDELARLAPIDVVPPERLDVIATGVHQGVAAELKPRRLWTQGSSRHQSDAAGGAGRDHGPAEPWRNPAQR